MKKIIIINGPNLNLLGKREPETYGDKSFDSYFKELVAGFKEMELTSFQSNVEGEIINKIQETGFSKTFVTNSLLSISVIRNGRYIEEVSNFLAYVSGYNKYECPHDTSFITLDKIE
jgi:hypothetical protein